MGIYAIVPDETSPPRRHARRRRSRVIMPSNDRNARHTSVRTPTPLRGPIRRAISGYRFYNPELGRWINRDPIGEWGGINQFGFVVNDSVNGIDLYGLMDHKRYSYEAHVLFGAPEGDLHARQWAAIDKMIRDRIANEYPRDSGKYCCRVEILHNIRSSQLGESLVKADTVFLTAHGNLDARYRPEVRDKRGIFSDRLWNEWRNSQDRSVSLEDMRILFPLISFHDGKKSLDDILAKRQHINQSDFNTAMRRYEHEKRRSPNDPYITRPEEPTSMFDIAKSNLILYLCHDAHFIPDPDKEKFMDYTVIPRFGRLDPVGTSPAAITLLNDVLAALEANKCKSVDVYPVRP